MGCSSLVLHLWIRSPRLWRPLLPARPHEAQPLCQSVHSTALTLQPGRLLTDESIPLQTPAVTSCPQQRLPASATLPTTPSESAASPNDPDLVPDTFF